MSTPSPVVFLLDVDNTLIDDDRFLVDLKGFLDRAVGPEHQERYLAIFEELHEEVGFPDHLNTLQRFRLEYPFEPEILAVSSFLVDYPFANRLYPTALDVIIHLRRWGPTVVFADGDVVFQPRRIERAGLRDVVDGVLIYVHKELELDDVEKRFPAERYVVIDDKLRLLAAVKMQWGKRVTTVFPRQGRHGRDVKALASYEPADLSINRIGDLLDYDLPRILNANRPRTPEPPSPPRLPH